MDNRFFRIHCFPFRMTDARMNKELAAKAKWLDFWANSQGGLRLLRSAPPPAEYDSETREVFV